MAMYANGVKPVDENYQVMANVWRVCESANIPVPQEVVDFFGGRSPNDAEIEVDILKEAKIIDGLEVLDVVVADIPSDVKVIRFFIG